MHNFLINDLNISELLSFQSILSSRLGSMEFMREKLIPVDEVQYDKLQIKKSKIDSRINHLIETL